MQNRLLIVIGLLGALAGIALLLYLLLGGGPEPRMPEITAPPAAIAPPPEEQLRAVRQEGTLRGRVIDGQSEIPLPDAQVIALAPELRSPPGEIPRWGDLLERTRVKTDQHGEFRIEALPPDYWNLWVEKKGYAFTTVPRAKFAETHEIRLYPGATIHGRIVFPDGSPAPGVRIEYTPQGTHSEVFSYYRLKLYYIETDADGRFRYEDLPPEKFTVEAYPRDYLPAPWTTESALRPGEVRDLGTHRLEGGFGMTVKVIWHEDNKPVEGVEVVVRPLVDPSPRTKTGQRRLTDAKGEARFQGLGGQASSRPLFTVAVNDPDAGPVMSDEARPFEPGSTVVIALRKRNGVVKGRVVRPDGRPLERFHVSLEPVGHNQRPLPVWGENGEFRMQGVPEGRYTLLARYGNLQDGVVPGVEVAVGGETDVGLIQMAEGAEIAGVVRLSSGRPIEKTVKVHLSRKVGEGWETVRYAYCQPDGGYSLKGLPPGAFWIQPSDGKSRTTDPLPVEIPAGTAFLRQDLVLEGQGFLKLSFVDFLEGQERPVVQPPVWLREEASGKVLRWTGEGTALRPGRYRMLLDLNDSAGVSQRYEANEVLVQEGETAGPIVVRLHEIRK